MMSTVITTDLAGLAQRAAKAIDPTGRTRFAGDLERMTSGNSSLAYSATVEGAGAVVIKVGPAGLPPTGNRDLVRQARVMKALAGTDVPVPAILGVDEGQPTEVPPLFVMERVEGEVYEPTQRLAEECADQAVIWRRVLAATSILADLHALDPAAIGLGDEPVMSMEVEVARWDRAFATVPPEFGGGPAAQHCHDLLLRNVPGRQSTSIVHGDYRLGNLIVVDDVIHAVIDWEIWSLGDGRIDLAWLLLMLDPEHPMAVPGAVQVPERSEIVRAYEQAGQPSTDLAWFEGFIRYKQAAICGLVAKNKAKRGEAPARVNHADMVPILLGQAVKRLG
jgi:aminoglycoside phosphotransferase (APT) family kinase protein